MTTTRQVFALVTVKDTGRIHRTAPTTYVGARRGRRTWCGLGWVKPSTLTTLAGVGKIAADPDRFLCGRCFGPTFRLKALNAHYATQDGRGTKALASLPPDTYLVWTTGEVWEWTATADALPGQARKMVGRIMEYAWGGVAQPVMGPDVLSPVADALREAGQARRDAAPKPPWDPPDPITTSTGLVYGVLGYRYYNTGPCGIAVVAKAGGGVSGTGPDWAAYISALPHNTPTGALNISGDVIEHAIRYGQKIRQEEAHAFFPRLPMDAWRD